MTKKNLNKKPYKMKTNYVKLLLLVFSSLFFIGCASKQNIVYFQELQNDAIEKALKPYESTIQVGDILSINVSAIDPEVSLPFNLYETPIGGDRFSNAKPLTHLVNAHGEINFPVLGKIKVEGLTTRELTEMLTTQLIPYINNAIVNIRLPNYKISVMGEVEKPGSYLIPNERVTVIEALNLAGDLTIYGNRKKVLLIREVNDERIRVNLDITSSELFNSPYFYLAQNDVLYVEPNKTRMNASKVGPNTRDIISSISLLISLVAIILR